MRDPAFLFYPGDWLGGTMILTRHQKGCYLDVLMAQFNSGPLSLESIKTILGQDQAVWTVLQSKFKQTAEGLYFNERLATEIEKRKNYTESRRQSRLKSDEDQVRIYLIKDLDTGYFKIGSSVNPLRRLSEMINQKNPAITPGKGRNFELFFQSEIVPRTEEAKLHNYFIKKRITGEWFELDPYDLSYVERTYSRTENENRNKNKDSIKKRKGGVGEKQPKPKKPEPEFPEFQDCMAAYHEFYKSLTGVSPNIKVQDGKALKDLILHFRSIANEGQPIVDGFRYVFKNWQKLDAFYQKQIDLTRIYTNINSIISELKNKRKNANSNTGNTDYEGSEFKRSVDEKIDRIYAQR